MDPLVIPDAVAVVQAVDGEGGVVVFAAVLVGSGVAGSPGQNSVLFTPLPSRTVGLSEQ